MFVQLLASRPVRQRTATGFATSITLHGFLVAAALYATIGTAPIIERIQTISAIYVPEAPAQPPPTPQPTPTQVAPATPAAMPSVPPGSAYLATQVETEVAIERNSPMPRYPATMRAAGIAGSARFRFVVDTLGRVELATVERIESTHEAFAVAVRESLPRMRFRAACFGGRSVRQLVEFPIAFNIKR